MKGVMKLSVILQIVVFLGFYFIVIPIVVYSVYRYVFKSKNELEMSLVAITLIMVVFCAIAYSSLGFGKYELYDTRDLVALQDSETLVVSRYSADSEIYYYYMQKIGDTYHPKKASQDLSVIKYTADDPVVKVFKLEPPNKIIDLLSLEYSEYKYEFYLPEGTVQEDFNVDLK